MKRLSLNGIWNIKSKEGEYDLYGDVPGSLQSGKAVEALQAADAGTVSEPIENLEIFLAEVAEFILEVINDYQITSEEIIEDGESIRYIGKVNETPKNTLLVRPSNVKVKIVPEIAYTESEKREWAIRLFDAGILDEQSVLEKFEISNISDVVTRLKERKEQEFQENMVNQKESHRTNGEGPEDTADMANQENMQMAAGQEVAMTPQALWTPEHTDLHIAFIQENQDAYGQHQDLFDAHIQNEQKYQ